MARLFEKGCGLCPCKRDLKKRIIYRSRKAAQSILYITVVQPSLHNIYGEGFFMGFHGICNKCGHCCLCNRDNNMTMLGLAAMHYLCFCRRPCIGGENRFGEVPVFKGGGFHAFGGAREEAKERACEDVRTGRGSYRYF